MEEKIKETKCQYCGKECKNVKVHERFCKLNPEIRKANVQHEKEKEPAKEQVPEQKPLIISNVQPSTIDPELDDVAWFEDEKGNRKFEVPLFIGMHENIPCVLCMTVYGRLIPPYLIPGFIGMFPKYHEFPKHEPEPQPTEEQPINTSSEPIKSPQEEDKSEQVITHAPEQKKKSLFAGIFGKKEEKTTQTTNSSADLAKRIIDAQGS